MADDVQNTMKPIVPNDQDKFNQQIIQFRVDPDTGFYTLSCSTDNGLHYQVILTADGRKFSDKDAASFWPFLTKYVSSLIDGATIEWADIKGKPEVITKDQLEERLAKLAIPTSFSWNDITDKPKLALKDDIPSLDGYAKLTDIPSVAGLVKEAELADYAKKSDLPNLSGYVKVSDLIDYAKKTDIPQSLSWDKVTGKPDVALKSELPSITGLAKETDLASVKATAESAESKAEQAQSTANSKVSSNYQWSVVAMDYNDIKTGGVYYNAENGDNYHAPAGDWGYLIVNGRGNGACSQLYLGDNTAGLYWRTFNGDNWSNWVKVASTNDLSGLVSQSALNQVKDLLNEQIAKKADASAIPSLDGYAKLTDIPSVTGLVKDAELANYAKKTDIPKMPDLSGYVTASSLMDYVKRTELPDFTQFAKKSEVPADVAHTSDLANYALKSEIPKMPDLSGYALKSDLPIVPTDLVHTAEMEQVKETANQAAQTASEAVTLANNAKATIDTSNIHQIKKPSEYSEGFSYEVKALSDLGIDLTRYDTSVQSGWIGLVKSVQVSMFSTVYVTQTVRVLGSYRPTTFIRNGSGDSWYPFELVTTW